MIQLRIFMVTMKQIEIVGISSASQAPGTSHKFPSSWSSSARYQIRLRQTVLLQKRTTARRRATVWYGVVTNRDAHARLVVVGEVFPTLSSNSPLLPSSPPTCHHRHPLLAARPSSQQDTPRSRGSHHHVPHSAIPFASPLPLLSSPGFCSLVKQMESRHHDAAKHSPPLPLGLIPVQSHASRTQQASVAPMRGPFVPECIHCLGSGETNETVPLRIGLVLASESGSWTPLRSA